MMRPKNQLLRETRIHSRETLNGWRYCFIQQTTIFAQNVMMAHEVKVLPHKTFRLNLVFVHHTTLTLTEMK